MAHVDGLPAAKPPARRRSTRDRPAKSPLSVEAVVDAALTILQNEGLDAVSMRRVAAALDTGPASLYAYVANREALFHAMLDRVVAGVRLENPDAKRWRQQLHALLDRLRDALGAHPGIAEMTLARSPTTDAVLGLVENLMGILLVGGITARYAGWASDLFILLATAAAREDGVRRPRPNGDNHGDEQRANEIYGVLSTLPPAKFPIIVAHAADLVAGDGPDRFRFAVDVAIDGLTAQSHKTTSEDPQAQT
jgi:AcrR family transcriptional regulator